MGASGGSTEHVASASSYARVMRWLVLSFLTAATAASCGSSGPPGSQCIAYGGTCIVDSMICDAGMCVAACVREAPSSVQDCDSSDGYSCCLSF
jgi:hypothetical protein